jgi:hypothetical protein
MTKKRIKMLADFFYSSESSRDVPLRLACVTGRYSGFDLTKDEFVSLFMILSQSQNLKADLTQFIEAKYDEE